MPLTEAVSGLLTAEWARFVQGVRNLDPAAQDSARIAAGRIPGADGAPKSINIPGWDDVVKIDSRTQATPAEYAEARQARQENRPSRNAPAVTAQLARNAETARRIASSAQPDYMQAWGSILTAIDNVQDLASSISTLGRLTLWGATRVPGIVGLVSPATATVLARMGLSLGMRAFWPIGVVLTISDLLNLIGLWGTGASVVYAILCGGSGAGFAAGAPTAIFKRSLKKDVAQKATTNPFGRKARLARGLKMATGRVGLGDAVEIAQTTEQLWGYGLSFGSTVGFLAETAAAVELVARGVPVSVNAPQAYEKSGAQLSAWIRQQTTADVIAARQAAAVLATAPSVARVQAHFTDDEHLLTMLVLTHCAGVLTAWTKGLDVDDMVTRVMHEPLTVPRLISRDRLLELAENGVDVAAAPRWWLAGFPVKATPAQLIDDGNVTIAAAGRAFMFPRRDEPEGSLFGTLVSQLAENLWFMLTKDDHALKWELAPDYAMFEQLALDGVLLNNQDPPDNLWRFWQAMRARYAELGDRMPAPSWYEPLAASLGVSLIRMLPPTAPYPAAWADTTSP